GRVGHLALGVHVAMPHAARRDAIDQLDAADLDHAVAVERVEPRRLRIEHDLAQSWSSLTLTTPSFPRKRPISNRWPPLAQRTVMTGKPGRDLLETQPLHHAPLTLV